MDRHGWRWVRRAATAVVITAGLLVGLAGPAMAIPQQRWTGGEFLRAGAPVYAESVDGWGCHVFFVCRDEERRSGDPHPDWFSTARFEGVLVECRLGAYYKIHQGPGVREGWTLASGIRTYRQPDPCTAFDF